MYKRSLKNIYFYSIELCKISYENFLLLDISPMLTLTKMRQYLSFVSICLSML
jgi:hypothetical protein